VAVNEATGEDQARGRPREGAAESEENVRVVRIKDRAIRGGIVMRL
jgi:hypothetical protein